MKFSFVLKKDIINGIRMAIKDINIVGLKKVEGANYRYDYINDVNDFFLGCASTVLPPKQFLFPQTEDMLKYDLDSGEVSEDFDNKKRVLFGVSPCDINAINILDNAFSEDNRDPFYLTRRKNTLIVGLDCFMVCDEHSFCGKVGSQNVESGFDAMLYKVGSDKFVIKFATEAGELFFQKYFDLSTVEEDVLKNYFVAKKKSFSGENGEFEKLDQLPDIYASARHHPIWDEEGGRCLSCGSCVMVCPTCYCFDVVDEPNFDLKTGKRRREWDGCMLKDFAVISGGVNFRGTASGRLQHRMQRKFNYVMRKNNGKSACVGCGRCVRACLAEISPKKITEKLISDF